MMELDYLTRVGIVDEARRAADSVVLAAEQHARPSAVYRPSLSKDGDQWCALYGANLIEGCAGFGSTAERAMEDFDRAWKEDSV